MNLSYFTYNLAGMGIYTALLSVFWVYGLCSKKHKDTISQRLGYYPEAILKNITGSPRIWVHAVSVGEVRAAGPIIDAVKKNMPGSVIILSVTTPHGHAFAKKTINNVSAIIYTPADFYLSIKRALFSMQPDLLAIVETEIWPNWLIQAHKMGVKTVFLNGRISNRTIGRYLKIKPFIQNILGNVDAFSMISDADGERIRNIGALQQRVFINGNAKFDIQTQSTDLDVRDMLFKMLDLDNKTPVFIAGSTRRSEEGIVLDVFKQIQREFPDIVLIIAPRHVERSEYVANLVKRLGLRYRLRTDLGPGKSPRTEPVVILNTIGELQAAYGLATLVFCGGSLEPLGGQNLLEPAAWGKPVFYGPFTDDFTDARICLENTGGGLQVESGSDLAKKAIHLMQNPDLIKKIGEKAQLAFVQSTGAARRHAMVIKQVLQAPCI